MSDKPKRWTMSDKPKRWTWGECSQKYKAGAMVTPSLIEDAFRTNDKYIDWQEKRINELNKRIDEMRDECISILERDVAPLDIKCMEQEKTIIKLKEALEFYSKGGWDLHLDCFYDVGTRVYFAQCDIEKSGVVIQKTGEIARTALKECFPEKEND